MEHEDQMGLGQWANRTLGVEEETEEAPVPPGAEAITVADLLARDDLPPLVREWLELYAAQGEPFAMANNPPAWVADEACWEKAKRASDHAGASDPWAFAAWWYLDHAGCAQK